MLTDPEVAALRSEQEKWMPDIGSITRPSAEPPTFDEDTGLYVPTNATELYTGKLRVMPISRPKEETVGEASVTVQLYNGTAPWDAGDIHINDIVTLSASNDPNLIGRSLIVRSVDHAAYETARRFMLEEHQQSEE